MIDPEIDPASIGGEIVNPVGHRAAELLDQEVVHPDLFRIARRTIFTPTVLEVADQFLLLRIDRDHRLALGQRSAHRRIDVVELRVPIRMAVALQRLTIALQAEAHAVQQFADQRTAHLVTLGLQFLGQPPQALACPAQRRLRVAARTRLNQRAQIAQQRCILHHRRLAPAARAPNPIQIGWLRRRQLSQSPPDRARRNAGCRRYRSDPAIAGRRRFGRRYQPPSAFVEKRRDCRKSLPDRFDINHPHKIWGSCAPENPISICRQNPIHLISDGPLVDGTLLCKAIPVAQNCNGFLLAFM